MSARTIVFAGVGGQGVLSAARFLGEAAFRKGIDVAVSQLHGMSQRGGIVTSTVTIGEHPVQAPETIDVLVGLELIEACRLVDRLGPNALALCNTQLRPPPRVALRREPVAPMKDLTAAVRARAKATYFVDGLALAKVAGHPDTLNAVMLGALSWLPACPVADVELLATMLELGSPAARLYNERAFALGRDAISGAPG